MIINLWWKYLISSVDILDKNIHINKNYITNISCYGELLKRKARYICYWWNLANTILLWLCCFLSWLLLEYMVTSLTYFLLLVKHHFFFSEFGKECSILFYYLERACLMNIIHSNQEDTFLFLLSEKYVAWLRMVKKAKSIIVLREKPHKVYTWIYKT